MAMQEEGSESRKQHRRSRSVEFCVTPALAVNFDEAAWPHDFSEAEANGELSGMRAKGKQSGSRSGSNKRRAVSWDVTNERLENQLGLKKRLASYRLLHLEAQIKNSLKKSCRWVKGKYDVLLFSFK
ncbi:hypothetical protein KP509_21G051200 [Ceratopteris richardii]|nr:hypothetical protein KP509_21G051200 [Ceratopteris richardii]